MKRNLKRLLTYYRPYSRALTLDIVCAVISSAIALVIPFGIRYVVSSLSDHTGDDGIRSIIVWGIVLSALIGVQFLCNYYIAYAGHVMGAKIEADMRRDIFDHYQKLSFSFYDERKTGELLSRVTSDLYDITEVLHHGPENIVICTTKIVGALVLMSIMNPLLSIVAYVVVPAMILFGFIYNKRMRAAFEDTRVKIGDVNAQIEDSLSGIRVVKSFANEELENRKFSLGNMAFLKAKKRSYRYLGGYTAGINVFAALMMVVIMVFGGLMIINGSLQVADMLAFLLYITVLTEPVKQLVDFTEMFQNGFSGFERFMQIMDIVPDIRDKEGASDLINVKGDVSFENVTFHYGEEGENVFEKLNLNVPAGAYYAIVGPSGIGKTTLVSLIPRFYEAEKGSIKIDEKNIKDVTMSSLRRNIGVVQQDVYLFSGTVFDNILYGKPDAARQEVIEAAKKANAHDFIMRLPKGYDTYIGQRGVKLSGGQKQRLSIARVFLKDPPILIFDEATSALDGESERVVQESMDRLSKMRTTFVIAHRLSTVKNAQRIIVMSEEGIREESSEEFFADNNVSLSS